MLIYERNNVISKKQVEVWEAKEVLYDKVKGMKTIDAIKYLMKSNSLESSSFKSLKPIVKTNARKRTIKKKSLT